MFSTLKGITYLTPQKKVFGVNAVDRIGQHLKDMGIQGKAIIVTDPGVMATGAVGRVEDSLKKEGFTVAVFDQEKPEPDDVVCDSAADFAREQNGDFVIGLGGGSAIDIAKVAAQLLALPGKTGDYLVNTSFPKKGAPLIAVPTTSGTGTELDEAVPAAAFGRYFHQGQICIATNRIIVDRKIYPEFVEKFVEVAKKVKVGDPDEPDTIIGPMITKKPIEKLTKILDDCESEGAKVVLRGKVEGNLMWPSVVIDVKNDMTIAQTELFGPVATIIPVDGEEEAIKVANDSDFGLSGAVFSGSLERGINVAKQIDTGMIHVNDQTVNVDPGTPFGGEKSSGLGRYCGAEWSIDDFTTVKWISVQNEYRQWPF